MGFLLLFCFPVFVMLVTSYQYFVYSDAASLARKIATSAHGLVGAVVFIAALAASLVSDNYVLRGYLFIIPYALIVVSLIWYRGYKAVHFLQLINIPAMLVANVLGFLGLRFTI